MKTIDLEELKQIQLDIVQALHDFCMANEIKYSLSCGTLLGAIRHGGYIPWDDDIDVYMERKDYNRFVSLYPQSDKGIYEFASLETTKHWNIPYGKLYDNRTLMIEEGEGWSPIGVNIDIFPVDSVPRDMGVWRRYNRFRTFLLKVYRCKKMTLGKRRSFGQNLLILFAKIPLFLLSKRFVATIISKYAQYYNEKKDIPCLFENVLGLMQKRPFDKDDFSETILHKFENRMLCVMKGYDNCLKCGFGDYMKLPPIEKQKSHHIFEAYWK